MHDPSTFSPEQVDHIVQQCMDTATNVKSFRQVIILTVSNEGMINVSQQRVDSATQCETVGLYRLMAADTEQQLIARWQDNGRPHHEDEQ